MNDNLVDAYGWSSDEGPHSCDYVAPRVLEILSGLSAKRILDIGAGNGKLCSEIYRAGFEVTGVEFDKKGFEIAQQQYPNINFYNYGVQDDPRDLLKDEAQFDVVVSTEVIEHLFSPHLLPLYAKSILKDNGYLIISTPYHGYIKNLALSIFNKWDHHHTPLWHGGHIKFWSRNTLTQLLLENGFREVGFSGVGRFPYLWKSMVLVAQRA